MIRFVFGKDLPRLPRLADSMFRDRAEQFHHRLAWDVHVDDNGCERDAYDRDDALYCIYELPDGTHGGSGRLMPTLGPTMYADHFSHLSQGVEVESPLVWEITRLCVSPRMSGGAAAASRVCSALMLAGCEVGMRYGLTHFIAVIDPMRLRVYRGAGWAPEVIGEDGEGRERLVLGLWEISELARASLVTKLQGEITPQDIPTPAPMAAPAPQLVDVAA